MPSKRLTTKPGRKRPFSLIELLVVISILLILISLIQPSFLSMINHSKRISCLTQLGSTHQTMVLYAEDFANLYPESNPRNRRHLVGMWDKTTLYDPLTQTYGLKAETLICPAKNLKPGTIRSGPWEGDMSLRYAYIAGVLNSMGRSYSTNPNIASLNLLQNQSSDIVLADLNMSFFNYDWAIYNHSRDFSTDGVGRKIESLPNMLNLLDGGNRISNDGSGQWVSVHEMGKNDQSPDAQDLTTAKYSHWSNLRPYYW